VEVHDTAIGLIGKEGGIAVNDAVMTDNVTECGY
jgi:hypothetical protein